MWRRLSTFAGPRYNVFINKDMIHYQVKDYVNLPLYPKGDSLTIKGLSVLNYSERNRQTREDISYNMLTEASPENYPFSIGEFTFVTPVIIETCTAEFRTESIDWYRLAIIYGAIKDRYSSGRGGAFPVHILGANWIKELELAIGKEFIPRF